MGDVISMNNLEGKKLSCFEELLLEWFNYGIEPILKSINYKMEVDKPKQWVEGTDKSLPELQKFRNTELWIYKIYILENHKGLKFTTNLNMVYNIFERFFYKWLNEYFDIIEEDVPEDMIVKLNIKGTDVEYPIKKILDANNLSVTDLPKIHCYEFIATKDVLTFEDFLWWINQNCHNLVTVLHNIVAMNNDENLFCEDYLQTAILPYRFKDQELNAMIMNFNNYYSSIVRKGEQVKVKLIFNQHGNRAIIQKVIKERD